MSVQVMRSWVAWVSEATGMLGHPAGRELAQQMLRELSKEEGDGETAQEAAADEEGEGGESTEPQEGEGEAEAP